MSGPIKMMPTTTAVLRAPPSSSDVVGNTTTGKPKGPSLLKRFLNNFLTDQQKANQTQAVLDRGASDMYGNIRGVDLPFAAARALNFSERTLICVGREGVAGALVLGESLMAGGGLVGFVSHGEAADVLREGIQRLHPDLTTLQMDSLLYALKANSDAETGNAAAKSEARAVVLLEDSVVAIAVPDAHAPGGSTIPPLYEVVRAANSVNMRTIAVGSSGDEVGSGKWTGVQRTEGASTTPSTFAVKARYPALGASAIGMIFSKLRGKLADAISPDMYAELMTMQQAATVRAGSQDSEPGMSIKEHQRLLASLYRAVALYEKVPARLNTPTDVAVFDSSNGAFIAAKVLKAELNKLGYPTNFIIVVDHGNAPYGQYTGDNEYQVGPQGNREKVLYRLVSDGLKTAEELGAALAIMACNTACTAPEAQDTVAIPVVDLIQVTAKAMARHGGSNPVMISTPVTALSETYPEAVFKASGGLIDLKKTPTPGSGPNGETGYANMIGAPRWAPAINNLEHIDPSRAAENAVMVREIVELVPADATSVWLTCTHYPVLQSQIEQALKERGIDTTVFNPMEYQARATVEVLTKMERANSAVMGQNRFGNQDRVYTSAVRGMLALVKTSVGKLYASVPVEMTSFGQTAVQTHAAIGLQQARDARGAQSQLPLRGLLSAFPSTGNPWVSNLNES